MYAAACDMRWSAEARQESMSETESQHVHRVAQGIAIDLELCKACGICRNLCPRDVFDLDERGYPIVSRLDQCTVCMICEYHCPDFAISVSFTEETRAPRTDGQAASVSKGSKA